MSIPMMSLSASTIDVVIKITLLLFFLVVYGFTSVIGISIFLHFRWFGLPDKSQKTIEGLFILVTIIIFIWNVGLLFALS